MKSAHIVTTHRPFNGLVALVRAGAAMQSFWACAIALHLSLPAGYPLDRAEDQVHPGERSA